MFSPIFSWFGVEGSEKVDFYEALIWFQYIPLCLLNYKSLFTMDDQLVKMYPQNYPHSLNWLKPYFHCVSLCG